MIKLYFGNIGSGKTASCVREMMQRTYMKTYSNILTNKLTNNIVIKRDMLIKKEFIKQVKEKNIYAESFNENYWKEVIKKDKNVNVIIDEAHTIYNSRRAMSKQNIIFSDFLAMLRRIIGNDAMSNLILVSQLSRRLDPIVKEMANNIKYFICHFRKTCNKCNYSWKENNEFSSPNYECPICNGHDITKHSHIIEIWEFKNNIMFETWFNTRQKTYFKHYLITDIEKYFPFYNTLQWDNLIS